ncbi:MAG: hypothetical protein ACT4QG_04225 [Sporichthyaceae bacterium]
MDAARRATAHLVTALLLCGLTAACSNPAGCNGRAQAAFDLVRQELVPLLPPADREGIGYESDCDSYGSPYTAWDPADEPAVTFERLKAAGWRSLPSNPNVGTTSGGYGSVFGDRQIEVYFLPNEDNFNAFVEHAR